MTFGGGSTMLWGASQQVKSLWTKFSHRHFFPAADCARPAALDETMLSEGDRQKSSFPEGASVTLACDLGYNRTSGSGLVTCLGGKWTQPDLVCTSELLSRHVTSVPLAGQWGGIRDSHWMPRWFHATENDCGGPPEQPNMIHDLSGGTHLGAIIKVSCKEGWVDMFKVDVSV